MGDLRNKEGFEESKRLDKGLIDQITPHLTSAVNPYLKKLSGRDIDMIYTHRTMQVAVDFKRPEEINNVQDGWYYLYREFAWKHNIAMCVVLEDRSNIESVSKVKLMTKNFETGYRDCDFKHFMQLNKLFIDTAEQRNSREYQKRMFQPVISDEVGYEQFCRKFGIEYR